MANNVLSRDRREALLHIVGRLIQKARKACLLNQTQFAKRLGTTQSVISRIEQGEQNLTVDALCNIADVLDRQMVDLLPREF